MLSEISYLLSESEEGEEGEEEEEGASISIHQAAPLGVRIFCHGLMDEPLALVGIFEPSTVGHNATNGLDRRVEPLNEIGFTFGNRLYE